MSNYSNNSRPDSLSIDRRQSIRSYLYESEVDVSPRKESLPNILPELSQIVRKLLPHELLLNTHVRNVEYIEHGCERFSGTLYMTIFRLVFAPDNEMENNNLISSGNKYISEYDIPLTSIYKINVAPMDSRSGFRSFKNEHQMHQSETRTFNIITRDFRNITFSKASVKKSSSTINKPEISSTKMETYIDALRVHCRFQDKEQLYPYLATQRPISSPKSEDGYSIFLCSSPGTDEDVADFCMSTDERIKSYLICQDWNDELQDANENRWTVDQNKFDKRCIARDEGPFIRLTSTNRDDSFKDLIWHWTHTSEVETDRRNQQKKKQYMLVTVPGIGEMTVSGDSLRRTTTDLGLAYSCHNVYKHQFQRYNLAKFPCNLKRLEASFEKLVEICVTMEEEDDKWWTKLNACKWLKYVSKALHGAASLAKSLNFKHIQLAGSDIDNSCLMSSLIQILLRPQCRTIKGFCELIVREWIIHGHPFRERFGQVISDVEKYPAQESPIFLLFLDCIHQLINQNPFLFEFTDYFLIELYHNVCYCYQHTFAFNSVLERLNAINNCPKNVLILSSFDFSLYLGSDVYHLLKNNASVFALQKIPPPPPPPPHPSTPPPPPRPSTPPPPPRPSTPPPPPRPSTPPPPPRTSTPSPPPRPSTTPPPPPHPRPRPRQQSNKMSHIHELLKQNLGAPRLPNRPYRLEAPKPTNFTLDVPPPPPPPSPVRPPSPARPPSPSLPPTESGPLTAEQFEYDNIEAPQKFPSNLYVDWRAVNLVLWSECYCRYDQNYMSPSSEQELSMEVCSLQERFENARTKAQQQMTIDALHSINHANSWYPQMLDTHV